MCNQKATDQNYDLQIVTWCDGCQWKNTFQLPLESPQMTRQTQQENAHTPSIWLHSKK
jgi:hypothetical protein